jgi:hypothetical protein
MVRARRILAGALVLLAGAFAAGCASAPPEPESMRDPGVDFTAFRTFGWAPAPGVDPADQPLLLLDQNIRAAIGSEMRRRGYVESPDDPDLRIAYETASQEKIESNPVRIGIGVGSWGGSAGGSVNVGSSSVRNYREGTLVIHAIDTARNAEVWQGRVSARLGKNGLEPAAVRSVVSTAMRDFPARPGP